MRALFGFSFLVLAAAASAQNLVVNGDFSLGNTGFTSGHTYVAPATDALYPENTYTIVANTRSPFVLNGYGDGIVGYNDHTSGSGLFMAVNGAVSFNSLVWSQTLTGLTAGQTYRFSTWVSRWTPSNEAPAALQVTLGNVLVTSFTDPNTPGIWEERTAFFTATSSTADLQIRSLQVAFRGNDFGLDDISVQAVPEPASMAALTLGLVAVLRRKKA